jgi:hypothetical protein
VLGGRVPQTQEELLDELRTLDPARVEDKIGEFTGSLLLGVPEAARLSAGVARIGFPESLPSEGGERHHHVDWPADASTFSADEHRLEWVTADGRATTMQVGEVVGLLSWRDGTRQVVARDGDVLEMDARQWQESDLLTRAIDGAVPHHLHLPRPDRAVSFRPMAPGERWVGAAVRWADTSQGLGVMAGIFTLLSVLWMLGSHTVPAVVFLVVAAILGGRLWLRERGGDATVPASPA